MLFSVSLCLMLPDFAWALELVVRRCHALRKGEKSCEVEPEPTMDGQRAGGTGIIHKGSLYVVFVRGRSCRELQQPHGHAGLAGHLCKVFPLLHLAPQHPRVNFRLAGTAPMCAQTACKRPELCCRQGLPVLRCVPLGVSSTFILCSNAVIIMDSNIGTW